jgi:hypothetical protein
MQATHTNRHMENHHMETTHKAKGWRMMLAIAGGVWCVDRCHHYTCVLGVYGAGVLG